MRSIILGLIALSTFQASSPPSLDKANGHWSGAGQFFSNQVGGLPVALQVANGRPIAGKLGDATLQDLRTQTFRDRIEVSARLSSPASPTLDKRHVVFVVTTVTDSTITAEFHLKSNGFFDPFMREGRVRLSRNR
jgi:hypothetical protein